MGATSIKGREPSATPFDLWEDGLAGRHPQDVIARLSGGGSNWRDFTLAADQLLHKMLDRPRISM